MKNTNGLISFRTWIEISSAAVKRNYRTFRTLIGKKVSLMGVIKSNAYGHGLMTMARSYEDLGFDWLGVDSISEALKLRREGVRAKILVLGYTQPENIALAGKQNISLTISAQEHLLGLPKARHKTCLHIKVDTGMHRQGFYVADLPRVIKKLKSFKHITVEGVFTHFAAAKNPKDTKDTYAQVAQFNQARRLFLEAGYTPIFHAAATGGTINFPDSHYDMVRVGMGMYGYWPDAKTKEYFDASNVPSGHAPLGRAGQQLKKFLLYPVLSWKTIVSELKWVEKGQKIGYDYTERVEKRTRLAVLPIGYWHGFWRAFSSKASVLVHGKRCKVLGRVSMDMVVVDVTDVKNVRVGDEVVLIGKQGQEFVSADELGKIAGTSCYEILTRLNPLIKKYYK